MTESNSSVPSAYAASTLRLRTDVLIQMKEVSWIVMCFHGYQAVPAITVGFCGAVVFVSAHEVDVNSRFHGRSQARENAARPRDVFFISGRLHPIGQDVHDIRGTAVAKRGLLRGDPARRAA